jgi:Xaa-Pro aminopeptidase
MLDRLKNLMESANADALWITGPAQHNPSMVYFTGICHMSAADLFLVKGKEPIILCNPMEREEAAKAGFQTLSTSNYDIKPLLKQTGGNRAKADALKYLQIFKDIGLEAGRVLVYGQKEVGPMVSLVKGLHDLNPLLEFEGDSQDAVILEARSLKTQAEIEHIRRMGKITARVVGNTQELLSSSKLDGEILIKADGSPLKLGEVKAQINLWLAEYGAEAPEDTIFALGRDSALPHSIGNPEDLMCLGKTIVFDIFPCEKGGGYFYDFTRTWSLGYATEETQSAYNQVKQVYETLTSELELGRNPNYLQQRTCDLFESLGHATIRQDQRIESGYVHGIGHGVGLDVHEKPWFGFADDPSNNLQVGSVFTIEPGLYYPEKGFGIRLEDTWYCDFNGTFRKFVDYPMELVVPVKG